MKRSKKYADRKVMHSEGNHYGCFEICLFDGRDPQLWIDWIWSAFKIKTLKYFFSIVLPSGPVLTKF
jgi:hypothetical protein